MLDREALRQYRNRLAALDEELDDAEANMTARDTRSAAPNARGGVYRGPQAVLDNVFAKVQADFESFSIDVERLIDGGNVVVMQGHYVAKGKATGNSVRAAVAHALEISDGKIVRFDRYVDSATLNPIIGA